MLIDSSDASSVGLFGRFDMPLTSQIVNLSARGKVHNASDDVLLALCQNVNMSEDDVIDPNAGPIFIGAWRKKLKLKQRHIAEIAGVSGTNTVSQIETGDRSLTMRWLRIYSEALGIPVGILAQFNPDDLPEPTLQAILDSAKPPPRWTPSCRSVERLLAGALLAAPDARVSEDDLRLIAHAAHAGLEHLAALPTKEGSDDYWAGVEQVMLRAVRDYRKPPGQVA